MRKIMDKLKLKWNGIYKKKQVTKIDDEPTRIADVSNTEIKRALQNNIKFNVVNPERKIVTFSERENEIIKKDLDRMVTRNVDNLIDAYENMIEMKRFLSYPHDSIKNAEQRIYVQLHVIKTKFGEKAYNRGLEIAEYDKFINKMYNTMTLEERLKIKKQIINNAELRNKLRYLRYYPRKAAKMRKSLDYQAVYSKMMEEERSRLKERGIIR